MAHVIFHAKPGCLSNGRQKALLAASGHVLEIRNLLAEPWTPDSLRPFFGDRPVAEWFNPSAPRIKSGAIDPATMSEAAALALLCADPILIRRPLMQSGTTRMAGFDPAAVEAWIGLNPAEAPVTDACPKTDTAPAGPDPA